MSSKNSNNNNLSKSSSNKNSFNPLSSNLSDSDIFYTNNFIEHLTITSQRNLLIYSATDLKSKYADLFPSFITTGTHKSMNFIQDYLNESLLLIYKAFQGVQVIEKEYQFFLLDWYNIHDTLVIQSGHNFSTQSFTMDPISHWRPVFEITYNDSSDSVGYFSHNNSTFLIRKIHFNEWKWHKVHQKNYLDAICDENGILGEFGTVSACGLTIDLPMTTGHILLIIACSILMAIVVGIGAILTR